MAVPAAVIVVLAVVVALLTRGEGPGAGRPLSLEARPDAPRPVDLVAPPAPESVPLDPPPQDGRASWDEEYVILPLHLSGTVRSADGQALPGARVEIVAAAVDETILGPVEADERGRYAFDEPVWVGFIAAAAEHGGYDRQVVAIPRQVSDAAEPRVVDFFLRERATISGSLHWTDGTPCAGARLRFLPAIDELPFLHGQAWSPRMGQATTDDEGAFGPVSLPAESVVRVAVAHGGAKQVLPTLQRVPRGEDTWALHVERPTRVMVTLVPGGVLQQLERGLPKGSRLALLDARTSTQRAAVHLGSNWQATFGGFDPGGTYDLWAHVSGFEPARVGAGLVFVPGDNTIVLPLDELERRPTRSTWRVTCSFRDERGTPLLDEEAERLLGLTAPALLRGRAVSLVTGDEQDVILGLHGNRGWRVITFSIPPPVRLELDAAPEANRWQRVDRYDRLSVQLPPAGPVGTLTVHAVDDRGGDLPVQLVLIHRESGTTHQGLSETQYVISMDLPPGGYDLTLTPMALLPVTRARASVAAGEETVTRIEILRSGGLVGVVSPPPGDGESVALLLQPAGSGLLPSPYVVPARRDGSFSLSALAPGDYVLTATRWPREGAGVSSALPLSVAPGELTRVSLHVAAPQEGVPVTLGARADGDGAWLVWLRADDESGSHLLEHVQAGKPLQQVLAPGRYRYVVFPSMDRDRAWGGEWLPLPSLASGSFDLEPGGEPLEILVP